MTQIRVDANQNLAKLLERQRLIPTHVLDGLLKKARTLHKWVGQVAVDDKLVSYAELAQAIALETKFQLIDLKSVTPESQSIVLLTMESCRTLMAIPISLTGSLLVVAMADPLDETIMSSLRSMVNYEVSPCVAPLNEINAALEKWNARVSLLGQQQAHGKAKKSSRDDDRNIDRILTSLHDGRSPEETAQNDEQNSLSIDLMLYHMEQHHASDLHLAVGSPPMMRVDGELVPMPFPNLIPSSVQNMIYAIMSDLDITQFERNNELDFAYSIPKVSRYRVNVHRQRGSVGAVLRTIPGEMPTLDKLQMPNIMREITERPRGLVLVTGPTGSGKSTTLAAMIDEINRTRRSHIVTIEDPIEFLHKNKMSVVTQREIGSDTESFTIALRHVLRQDPDVILIGEMRDLETIAAAITAAETGHLVFATLHTTSAAQTIERIIDVFPPHQQEQIRSQLSNTLEAIFTQTLLPKIDGRGRCCAQEILLCTPAIRNLIREGKVHQMSSVMQSSAKNGMQTLDHSLKSLVLSHRVSMDQAILKASNSDDFKALLAMG